MSDTIVSLQDFKNMRKHMSDRERALSVTEDSIACAVAADVAWCRRLPKDSEEYAKYVRIFIAYLDTVRKSQELRIRCIERYGTAEEKAAVVQWRLDHPDKE
jgi:hypothetical protein